MILWLALYLLARASSAKLRGVLTWVKVLKWIGGICGLVVILFALFQSIFIPFDGMALVVFSGGSDVA